MKLVFAEQAWEDYLHWQQTDKTITRRIHELIKDTARNPFSGLGKPEPLRYLLAGCWSRRITQEHRLVYKVSAERIDFLQARYHY